MESYPKNDKRRLYWLISLYLAGEIDEATFCDEFYYSYDLEIEGYMLDPVEKDIFEELNRLAQRFSPFDKDFELAPTAYTSKNELKDAAQKAKQALDKHLANDGNNKLSGKENK